jgi:serine O-acetyltransferase
MEPKHLGPQLTTLVDRVVANYLADERTHHIDREYLPSIARAIEINELLLQLTYPGGYGRRGLTAHNIRFHVGELLPRLWEHLRDEIFQCICHEHERENTLPSDLQPQYAAASTHATRFIERIPETRAMLTLDVQAHYDGDPAAQSTTEVILAYPGMLAITIQRYAHILYEIGVPKLPRIMSEWAHRQTGIDIHPGAQIGKSFCIDHGTGVVIGETAIIGDNCKIYQGVTLGALSFPKDERGRILRGYKRHPTLGNNVTIYANAIVLGGDTKIGDGAVIGGSVFLTYSVAAGHQVSITPPLLKVRPPRKSRGDDGGETVADWVI